ncbi:MAG TPA: hypothetical protein DEP51_04305 [Clostridiales bacterium]|nr:hypothetical protein [Clostridiales bacterium]
MRGYKYIFNVNFELVEGPISQTHIKYKLSDILFMLITGILCNCKDLETIIEFSEEKIEFFKNI